LFLDFESHRFFDRRQPWLGDVEAVKATGSVQVHSRDNQMDVVVSGVAVDCGNPVQVRGSGLGRQALHRGAGQALEIEPLSPFRREDQAGDGAPPILQSTIARSEELRLGLRDGSGNELDELLAALGATGGV
jgi:hypothetical protein